MAFGNSLLGQFEVSAVTAEDPLAAESESECPRDRLDYCTGDADFASADHTMCKYCGIGPKCPYNLDPEAGLFFIHAFYIFMENSHF